MDTKTFESEHCLSLETKPLKQNADLLKQNAKRLHPDPERLNSNPERLTDPKRLNIDAEKWI